MDKEEITAILEPVFRITGSVKISKNGFYLYGYWLVEPETGIPAVLEKLPDNWLFRSKSFAGYYYIHIIEREVLIHHQNLALHLILFFLTILATLIAGSLQQGGEFWKKPKDLLLGIDFSFTLILILGSHELGHYFACLKNNISASLPYFIPSPHPLTGTFGAFIKIKEPIRTRKELLEIGAAGPLMSFLISLLAGIYGIHKSRVILSEGVSLLGLGDNIIFKMLTIAIKGNLPQGYDILLHPIGYAAWLGFFVTALNLIPIGQLDGGHIIYALFGRKARILSFAFYAVLILLGIFYWQGWLVWGILLLFIGLKHPSLMIDENLSLKYKMIGYFCILMAILSFIPAPFRI
ncbi:MAG: site-2 protease family protein [Candidatus Coatesbacteria bacterium]|nr:site-2 protease family protein [Candidatus Coatesbacteria bacterium]